jgi:hypothetical protein
MEKLRTFAHSHLGVSVIGALLGVGASIINRNELLRHSFVGAMAVTFGYWVIFGGLVALGGKTPIRAAIACLLFFLSMNTAFYVHEWVVTSVFQARYLVRWIRVSALTPFGGWLVWHAREKSRLGILAAALPIWFLVYESYQTLAGILGDKVVQLDGIAKIVPTNAWYIANDAMNVLVYLGFVAYLVALFPKTKKRVVSLVAALVALSVSVWGALWLIRR